MFYRKGENKDIFNILELWNERVPAYKITLEKLTRILLCDDNYDTNGIYVAIEKGVLIGFCIGIKRKYPFYEKGLEKEKGWLYAIAVKKAYCGKGIGSGLLQRVENYLQKELIIVGAYSPHYLICGIEAVNSEAIKFFQHHDYVFVTAAYAMRMSLERYTIPRWIQIKQHKKETEGYIFSWFQWRDAYDLLFFLKEQFSVGWRKHVIQAILEKTACDTILICKKDNAVIGYVQRGIAWEVTRFGPFGIHQNYRNQGIGSVLLHLMWQNMKERKFNEVWFHSTDEEGKRFYERNGMQVERVLLHYEKVSSCI